MSLETIFQLAFAAGVLVAAGSVAGAVLERAPRSPLRALAVLLALGSAGAWVAFALRPSSELAVAAAGLSLCAMTVLAALALGRGLARGRRIDEELARAERRLRSLVERETAERAAELERTLARTRAESLSLLAEDERRIVDERRRAVEEQEREAQRALAEALARVEQRVEQRLRTWADDLERTQSAFTNELARIERRQQQLVGQAEARIRGDVERLDAMSSEQRQAASRLREEVERTVRQAVAGARTELETHESERQRALHELGERFKRREQELMEHLSREEADAAERLRASVGDLERRQLEELERIAERAAARYADAAAQQLDAAIRAARDDAARRLTRELARSVEAYTSDAQAALAERSAHIAGTSSERIERRLDDIAARLERQRDDAFAALERRLAAGELALRERLEAIASAAEGERAMLETRLQELARRVTQTISETEERLATLEALGRR